MFDVQHFAVEGGDILRKGGAVVCAVVALVGIALTTYANQTEDEKSKEFRIVGDALLKLGAVGLAICLVFILIYSTKGLKEISLKLSILDRKISAALPAPSQPFE